MKLKKRLPLFGCIHFQADLIQSFHMLRLQTIGIICQCSDDTKSL